MKTFLLIGILTTFAVSFVGQTSREEGVKAIESKLLDVPSATYKLSASRNGRGYEFCNTSNARVVRFRLGCVKKKNGVLKILSERELEVTELALPDEKAQSCRFWSSHHGFFPGEACEKGKLAVIEVVLRWSGVEAQAINATVQRKAQSIKALQLTAR